MPKNMVIMFRMLNEVGINKSSKVGRKPPCPALQNFLNLSFHKDKLFGNIRVLDGTELYKLFQRYRILENIGG